MKILLKTKRSNLIFRKKIQIQLLFIAKNNLNINAEFNTRDYDYEIVSFVDEVQIIDLDENIVVSVKHSELSEKENE